jgi:hypothetical protein
MMNQENFSFLGCITVCGAGWELYDSFSCSAIELIGIFKFLILDFIADFNLSMIIKKLSGGTSIVKWGHINCKCYAQKCIKQKLSLCLHAFAIGNGRFSANKDLGNSLPTSSSLGISE